MSAAVEALAVVMVEKTKPEGAAGSASGSGGGGAARGGKDSVLLETVAVGIKALAEQIAPAISSDEVSAWVERFREVGLTMPHGASEAPGDELGAEQSVPLPAGDSLSREMEELVVSGLVKYAMVDTRKRVKAVVESGDKNFLIAASNAELKGLTLLHTAARFGFVDSVQQLIKAGGKEVLFATYKDGFTVLHFASISDRPGAEVILLLIKAGGKKLPFMTDSDDGSALHAAVQVNKAKAIWSLCSISLRREGWS